MKLVTAYLAPRMVSADKLFISEMRAAYAFRKAKVPLTIEEAHFHDAASVFSQMLKCGVIRPIPRFHANGSYQENSQKFVTVSGFAHMLWLLIAREICSKDITTRSITPNDNSSKDNLLNDMAPASPCPITYP